jgi:hypothetical protein
VDGHGGSGSGWTTTLKPSRMNLVCSRVQLNSFEIQFQLLSVNDVLAAHPS